MSQDAVEAETGFSGDPCQSLTAAPIPRGTFQKQPRDGPRAYLAAQRAHGHVVDPHGPLNVLLQLALEALQRPGVAVG